MLYLFLPQTATKRNSFSNVQHIHRFQCFNVTSIAIIIFFSFGRVKIQLTLPSSYSLFDKIETPSILSFTHSYNLSP